MILRSFATFLVLIFALGACTSSPTPDYEPLPELTFAHLVTIPVQVQKMRVDTQTMRGAEAWDIANELPTPPDIALRRYLERRYKPVGADGSLIISLAKADVSVSDIPNDLKLLSYVPFADNHQYTFEIIIDLQSMYLSGMADTKRTLRFVRSTTLPPNSTIAYRDAHLQRLLESVIRDIDEAIMRSLSNEFGVLRKKDIPVKLMDIRTEKPKEELPIPMTPIVIPTEDLSNKMTE